MRNRDPLLVVLLTGCLLASRAPQVAAIDVATPYNARTALAAFIGSSSTTALSSGDADAIQTDQSHNLRTSASPAFAGVDVPTGALASAGTTKVQIAAAVSGKQLWFRGSFVNGSATTAYSLTFYSMPSGSIVYPLGLIPSGGTGWAGYSEGVHSLPGESLWFACSAGAGANLTGGGVTNAN